MYHLQLIYPLTLMQESIGAPRWTMDVRGKPFNLCPMGAQNINHQTEKQVQDTDKSVEENQFVRIVGKRIGAVDLERVGDCSLADKLTLAYLSVVLRVLLNRTGMVYCLEQ